MHKIKAHTIHYPHIVNHGNSNTKHINHHIMSSNSVVSICWTGPKKINNNHEVLGIEVSPPQSLPPLLGQPIYAPDHQNDRQKHPSQHTTRPMEDYVIGPTQLEELRRVLNQMGVRAVKKYVETDTIPPALHGPSLGYPAWDTLSKLYRTYPIN
jgi:hypothetical protein